MIQRKSGVIINIGSIAGVVPTPMSTLYGASKVKFTLTKHATRKLNMKIANIFESVGKLIILVFK